MMEKINKGNIKEDYGQLVEDEYGEFLSTIIRKNKGYRFEGDVELFDVMVNFPTRNMLETYVEELMKNIVPGESMGPIVDTYLNYSFIEGHVVGLIKRKEGHICSYDKANWIVKQYIEFLINGTTPDMSIDEGTFWKPGFGDGGDWLSYCESLIHLFYGEPDKYLNAYAKLLKA